MVLPLPNRFIDGLSLDFDDVLIAPENMLADGEAVALAAPLNANITLKQPFLLTTTDAAHAISLAQAGLLAIVPQTAKPSQQAAAVRSVKRYQAKVITNPITVTAETAIAEVMDLQNRYQISGIVVIDDISRKLVGIVSKRDIQKAVDTSLPVAEIMTKESLVTLPEGADIAQAESLMNAHNVERIPLVNKDGFCTGVITKKDLNKIKAAPDALCDHQGCLRVGAAIGTKEIDYDRITMLIDEHVDVILVEGTAQTQKALCDMVTHIRRQRAGHVDVIAALPVVTRDTISAVIDAGASTILLRTTPSAAYQEYGIGIPTLSAIMLAADTCAITNVPLFVEGLDTTAQQIKAFVAGCSGVACGADADLVAMTAHLQQAMLALGCADMEQLQTKPRFIALK